jgi:hypothetical protein
MAEKSLTDASWKTFAKGKPYKDAPLLKALTDLARAEREGPAVQLAALDALGKQADALLKQHKGDKELAGQLADMGKALDRARKAAELADKQAKEAAAKEAAAKAAQKAAEKAAEKPSGKESGDDEEEAGSALLTTRMLPLVRLVLKGEPMQVMVASAGKVVAVLLSRKPIPVARRKLLADQLQVSGGVKYFTGQCLLENGAMTFVLQAQVAGLAKRLKAALLAQTGLRINKMRCRGEDGDDHDDDEEAQLVAAAPEGGANGGADAPWPKAAALAKARLEWGQARQHAVSEIGRLKDLLADEYREAPGEQAALARALQRLDATIASMDDAMSDQLDQLLNAQPVERAALASRAASTLERLLGFVTRDEILATIDGNELAPDMKVAEPLSARLQAIATALR